MLAGEAQVTAAVLHAIEPLRASGDRVNVIRVEGIARDDLAIRAGQSEEAARNVREPGIEFQKEGRTNADGDHRQKVPVGIVHAPGEIGGPVARVPVGLRVADNDGIVRGLFHPLERIASGDIGFRRERVARRHDIASLRIDDAEDIRLRQEFQPFDQTIVTQIAAEQPVQFVRRIDRW